MKKILILLFVTFGMKAQKHDDKAAHYMASINIVNLAASSTTYLQYEICKNVRISLSLAVGLTSGIAATNAKEDIYDGYLKLGNKNSMDREVGIIGACVGTLTYIPAHHRWFSKKKNLEI